VTFDDSGSASPAVNLTGTVAPGSVVLNANQNYTIGGVGVIAGTGGLTENGPGTLTVNNTNTFTGPVTINGGTIQVNNGGTLGSGAIIFQSGTLVNSYPPGNTASLANPLVVPAGQTGTINCGNNMTLTGGLTGGGTLNLNVQSAVVTNYFAGLASAFTGTVNILGSGVVTMRINGGAFTGFNNALMTMNSPVDMEFHDNSGGNTFYFGALTGTNNGAVIGNLQNNAGPATLSIGALNLDMTFAGQFAGPANVVKTGTGTLTLTGNSTHTGTTTVSGGTLQTAGFFGGGLTVQSGGKISPGLGNGSIGTITVSNNVTLNGSATMNFDLSSSPGGANDQIVMAGGLLTMGNPQNYNFNLVNNALGAGTYNLITGGTNTSASGVGFTNNLPGSTRQTFTLSRPGSGDGQCYVHLTVTGNAGSLVWSGTNGSAWDVSVTTNWLNGSATDKFYNLDFVRFDDTSTNGNVSITGTVQPATVLVTNNLLDYTIGGGVLGGIASLTKSGSGTLILNSSNSFTGGTFVNGGTLQLTNNFYAGGVGAITLNGGTLYLNGVGTAATILSIGTNMLQTSGQPYAGFNLQGTGVLNLNVGGGGVFSPTGDWNGFSGTINFLTGNWIRELNTVSFGSSNAVWNFGSNGGLYNKNGGATISLGALFGGTGAGLQGASTATASLTTYVVGGINTNSVFSGTISDGAAAATALGFNGPGTLTLTGSNTFSGNTTVNAGALIVNNTAGSGTGTGVVTVNSGATLAGTGAIGGIVSVTPGGILAPGGSSPGLLTLNSDLSLDDASVLQFQLGTNSDQISVAGDLTLGGTLNISDAGGFGPGIYTLFNYVGALSVGTLIIGTTPASYTYTIDTSIQGQVNLVVSLPGFGNIQTTSNGLVLSGSGGTPNATFYLLGSTNLSTPVSNWTRLLTNQFDNSGNFNFTNAVGTNAQSFYLLQLQ
jgi:autotransporter-associated beta strand protein